MYSIVGTKHTSKWLGAHQKLNRLAFRGLRRYILLHEEPLGGRKTLSHFPSLKLIQHFEGMNGPDGMKVKSPGQNELAHFYDPYSNEPAPILGLLEQHEHDLNKALRAQNEERAAFEASWLAHAIVDGLTPAHHYPYEQEMTIIRGSGAETRTSKTKKMLVKGEGTRDTLKKNWQILGKKGLLSTHLNFEAGVATTLVPLRMPSAVPTVLEVAYVREHGLVNAFRLTARSIADLRLYERFYQNGWTISIARDVRGLLLPQMVKAVAIAWLLALEEK